MQREDPGRLSAVSRAYGSWLSLGRSYDCIELELQQSYLQGLPCH